MFFVGACSGSLVRASPARGALCQRTVCILAMFFIRSSSYMPLIKISSNTPPPLTSPAVMWRSGVRVLCSNTNLRETHRHFRFNLRLSMYPQILTR
jgi:hypothetical protein